MAIRINSEVNRILEGSLPILMYDLAGADSELRFSPFCWRTRFAVAHKRLELRTIPWRFTEKDTIAEFGTERVPVILDNGKGVHDSWHIAEYLEAAYPDRPSLFEGRTGRGLARFISNWTDLTLHPLIARWKVNDIFSVVHERDREYFRASREARFGQTLGELATAALDAAKSFDNALAPLRVTLGRQRYISGETPLYADYIVCAAFQWISALNPDEYCTGHDPITRWRFDVLAEYERNLKEH
jgi:glutathione S-transferase